MKLNCETDINSVQSIGIELGLIGTKLGKIFVSVQLPGNPYGDFNSCTRVEDCREKGKMCHGLKNQYADCLCKKGQCDIKGRNC